MKIFISAKLYRFLYKKKTFGNNFKFDSNLNQKLKTKSSLPEFYKNMLPN